jgi:hypothetical protein
MRAAQDRVHSDPWSPIRDGAIYCSPRCGYKCQHVAFERAHREAENLRASLGPQWTVRVWENCGWHYSLTCGVIDLHVNVEGNPRTGEWKIRDYTVFIQTKPQFVADGATPEEAFANALRPLRKCFDEIEGSVPGLLALSDPPHPNPQFNEGEIE